MLVFGVVLVLKVARNGHCASLMMMLMAVPDMIFHLQTMMMMTFDVHLAYVLRKEATRNLVDLWVVPCHYLNDSPIALDSHHVHCKVVYYQPV